MDANLTTPTHHPNAESDNYNNSNSEPSQQPRQVRVDAEIADGTMQDQTSEPREMETEARLAGGWSQRFKMSLIVLILVLVAALGTTLGLVLSSSKEAGRVTDLQTSQEETGNTSPTSIPTNKPVETTTSFPTHSLQPSSSLVQPTASPTSKSSEPTVSPMIADSQSPISQTDNETSSAPDTYSSDGPTMEPTNTSTLYPTTNTTAPTEISRPTVRPTSHPTNELNMSAQPTQTLASSPTNQPSAAPTLISTLGPTKDPTSIPTDFPIDSPLAEPNPTIPPTSTTTPTNEPSTATTLIATQPPTAHPTANPTAFPTISPPPSVAPTSQRLQQLIEFFLVPVSGTEVFRNTNSPQYRAAEFLADVDEIGATLPTTGHLADRYALFVFYYAMDGDDSWFTCSKGDEECGGAAWLNATANHCDWNSIACNEEGRVTSVFFASSDGNGLVGRIPREFALLTELENFVAANNLISGEFPDEFGLLTKVKLVVLNTNMMAGVLPKGFLENSPLEAFHAANNGFSGPIPDSFGNISTLSQLALANNNISGTIPPTLGNLENLGTLDLSGNVGIRGGIPVEIYSMALLENLYLDGCTSLQGTLSGDIGAMTNLVSLRVGDTGLSGILPSAIFTLPNLAELDVSGANFSGQLSEDFILLASSLRILKLSNNNFQGSIPAAFDVMVLLNVLELFGNDLLTGSISDTICARRGEGLAQLQVVTAPCDLLCTCCTNQCPPTPTSPPSMMLVTNDPTILPTMKPSKRPSLNPTTSFVPTTPSPVPASPTSAPTSSPTTTFTMIPTTSTSSTIVSFYVMAGRFTGASLLSLPGQLATLPNVDGDSVLFHLGDWNSPFATSCAESSYQAIVTTYNSSAVPVYLVPGDNEFNDCPNPTQASDFWYTHLLGFESRYWPAPLAWDISRQEPDYAENFAFVHNGLLVVGINLVGGVVHDSSEWQNRHQANLEWIDKQFHSNSGHFSVMAIVAHADPDLQANQAFFTTLYQRLGSDYQTVQVIYIHRNLGLDPWGLQPNFNCIPNLTVVVVEGSVWPPMSVTIDTASKNVEIDQAG